MLGNSGSDDDSPHFMKPVLVVERATRRITLDTVPQDGSEFIHKSRLEEELSLKPHEMNERQILKQWAKKKALEFSKYAIKLQNARAYLINKFPLIYDLPGKDEKKWCLFCLGSELYEEIYKEPCGEKVESHSPILSIVTHLQQSMVKAVLKYLYRWFLAIGMNVSIGRWVYSLFTCLEHPVDERCQKFIEVFKVACKKRMKVCGDKTEQDQLHLIFACLDHHFIEI